MFPARAPSSPLLTLSAGEVALEQSSAPPATHSLCRSKVRTKLRYGEGDKGRENGGNPDSGSRAVFGRDRREFP
jgi:hypothetical protein